MSGERYPGELKDFLSPEAMLTFYGSRRFLKKSKYSVLLNFAI
jgi:hypothetical protein